VPGSDVQEFARCLAHLERGAAHEAAGDLTAACADYNAAIRLEPRLAYAAQAATLPPPLPEFAWRRHRALRAWYRQAFDAALTRTRDDFPDVEADADLTRLRRSADMLCGDRPLERNHPRQRPHDLLIADLPPMSWLDRAELPWAAALEAATAAIRAEYLAVEGGAGFRPYIQQAQSSDWQALEGSHAWSSFFLYERAQRRDDNCARCPTTLAALSGVPLARAAGVPTEVFFSVLAPGAHIPPHFGLCNAKVVVHLPLIVPPGCTLRVDDETRGWEAGRLLAFDDSFEHEARNPSPQPRVVLIVEVWNPRLGPIEVVAVGRMLEAVQRFKQLVAPPL